MRLALSLVFLQFCFLLLNLLFLLQGGRHAFLCLLPRLRLNADFVFLDPLVISTEKKGVIKCKILTKVNNNNNNDTEGIGQCTGTLTIPKY